MKTQIHPVILSGGVGSRLWPLSRALYPKQLLPLAGDHSMLQATALRVGAGAEFAAPVIVANEEHRFIVAEQLRLIAVEPNKILLEPEGRNTAPAVALAALYLRAANPDALLLIMPSDHVIADEAAFRAAIESGRQAALQGKLVTFGITPDQPETGYGYIEAGAPLTGVDGAHLVRRFSEKPDRATAEGYLAAGGFYWNAGIFLFRADRYLEELARLAPDMLDACQTALAEGKSDLSFYRPDASAFRASPADSIDYAVMEKTADAVVVPVAMGWNDIGSWTALWDIGAKDANGNVAQGDIIALDSRNSLFRTDGPAIATVGLDDIIVVATADAVLVAHKDKAQDVKKIVDELTRSNRPEHITHKMVYRPWGSYQSAAVGERYQVKQLMVKPGEKLSLQKHHHRAEHWVVVQGTAKVTRDDDIIILHENESTFIPVGAVHRLENPGKIPLHIIEVQSGGYLGEDDIVRFDDTYGRI